MCVSFQTIYNAMINGTPCVVLEGSGRIADLIAQVAGLPMKRVTIALVRQLMMKFFGQEEETQVITWTKMVRDPINTLTTREELLLFISVVIFKTGLDLIIARKLCSRGSPGGVTGPLDPLLDPLLEDGGSLHPLLFI